MYTSVLWDADKLLQQLALGEDSRVEFMEVVFNGSRVREPRRERTADELAAFGNTLGGALIFSVSDAGEVRPMSREMMDSLEAYVSEICADSIHPPLEFTTQRLALPDGSSQDMDDGGDRYVRPCPFRLPLRLAHQRLLRGAGPPRSR